MRSYAVKIGSDLLGRLGRECASLKLGRRCPIISDDNVFPRYAPTARKALVNAGFEPLLIRVPAGERAKDLKIVASCYDQLARHRLERKSFIVALGREEWK